MKSILKNEQNKYVTIFVLVLYFIFCYKRLFEVKALLELNL